MKNKEYKWVIVFSEIDKELNASSETAWDLSGWKNYCDFGFGDV
tara:strand:- start:26 stop:157 length:132 start_codon:yes stop_codon:yes gene_type:complete